MNHGLLGHNHSLTAHIYRQHGIDKPSDNFRKKVRRHVCAKTKSGNLHARMYAVRTRTAHITSLTLYFRHKREMTCNSMLHAIGQNGLKTYSKL